MPIAYASWRADIEVKHPREFIAHEGSMLAEHRADRRRFIHLDGPSGTTRHLNLAETLPENAKRLRISGIGGSEFPEPTKVFDERLFVVVAESGFFLEGARAEIVAAIHNQIRALAELKK